MASADSSQFVVTTADETACETSTLKVRTLSPHLSATSTRTSGNFWTSSLLADLSVFPSLICDFCPSDQGFAYSFLQIPPHDGHPCCSAIHFLVAQACSGLSPVRARPWRANQNRAYGLLALYALLLYCIFPGDLKSPDAPTRLLPDHISPRRSARRRPQRRRSRPPSDPYRLSLSPPAPRRSRTLPR